MSPVARTCSVAFAVTFLAVAAPFACTLDWEVRPDPGAAADGGTDGTIDAAGEGSSLVDAPADTTIADGADCAALSADVAAKKPLARACQLGPSGQCATTVKDECDCDVVVRLPADPKTDDYVAAVAAYRSSCTPSCAACPQLPPMASWACLQSGSVIECFP